MELNLLKKLVEELGSHVSKNKYNLVHKNSFERTRQITTVFEDLYQAHNISACLRTCECFGLTDVHIIENTNEYVTTDNIDMGSSKWLNVHRYNSFKNNTIECIQKLKENKYLIMGMDLSDNSINIGDVPVNKNIAFIYGKEEEGLSDIVHEHADKIVKLPIYGFTQSFNVSVSVAVTLTHIIPRLRNEDTWALSEVDRYELLRVWFKKIITKSDQVEENILKRIEENV